MRRNCQEYGIHENLDDVSKQMIEFIPEAIDRIKKNDKKRHREDPDVVSVSTRVMKECIEIQTLIGKSGYVSHTLIANLKTKMENLLAYADEVVEDARKKLKTDEE